MYQTILSIGILLFVLGCAWMSYSMNKLAKGDMDDLISQLPYTLPDIPGYLPEE
jgi:hypothetical protein